MKVPLLNTFNSYNHKIQLTIEEESDGKICFLDVLIIRDGEKIKTNWYQKPTCSGRLINFTHTHTAGQNPKYIPLPYVEGHSEKLSSILKQRVS